MKIIGAFFVAVVFGNMVMMLIRPPRLLVVPELVRVVTGPAVDAAMAWLSIAGGIVCWGVLTGKGNKLMAAILLVGGLAHPTAVAVGCNDRG